MKLLLEYWPIIYFVGLALLAALVFWVDTRSEKKASAAVDPVKADVAALKLQVGAIEIRLGEAEGDIDGLPTKADLEAVLGEAKAAHTEASAANAGIRRIENFFLERGVGRS